MSDTRSGTRLPEARNYWAFAVLSVGLLWGVYGLELWTPYRVGHANEREGLPLVVPLIGTPVMVLCTWWRYLRARRFARGAVEVQATVLKIARVGVGPHKRVRLRYEVEGRSFERSVPLYDSVVKHLQVGGQITVLVWRAAPKRVRVPQNMEWKW